MTKVVYNACFGGFGLSREAILLGREISGNPKWGGACLKEDEYSDGKKVGRDYAGGNDLSRSDPLLVRVVEELGEIASGEFAKLVIEEIPEGTKYRIDEYDGNESVMTAGDYKWETA